MKNKGFTLVELIGVITIISIILLIGVPIYNSVRKSVLEKQYSNVVQLIETKAIKYAEEKKVLVVSVDTLIKEGYIDPDDTKAIYDPRNKKSLNCKAVRVTINNNSLKATISEETYLQGNDENECDEDTLKADNTNLKILVNEEPASNSWYNSDVTLSADLSSIGVTTGTYNWFSNNGEQSNESTIDVKVTKILQAVYTLRFTDSNSNIYEASVNINIDKENPIIYSDEITISDSGTWTKEKIFNIKASDQNGSGLVSYSVTTKACNETTYKDSTSGNINETINANGSYNICLKDRAGNIASANDYVVDKIDDVQPNCSFLPDNQEIILESGNTYSLQEKITCVDNESGLSDNLYYEIANTNIIEPATIEKTFVNDTLFNASLNGGLNYIWINVADKIGNKSVEKVSGLFNVKYKISYNMNSGIGNIEDQIKEHGIDLTLSSIEPTRTNYRFLGWSSNASATSATYQKGATYSLNEPIKLYAVWKLNVHTIGYDLCGGNGTFTGGEYINGTSFKISSTKPTMTGYTFNGWSTNGCGSSVNYNAGNSFVVSANTTLSAVWTAKEYTITFNKQSGSGGTSSITATYDQYVPYINYPERTGYSFNGYYTSTSGGGTQYYDYYGNGTRSYELVSNLTLYAYWTINQYTIYFDSNGGSYVDSITKNYNATVSKPTNPTNYGYTFGGWYSDYYLNNAYSFSRMPAEDITLYAKWNAIPTYTIIIDDCDGFSSYSDGSYQSGTSYSTRTYAYPSSGYTFKGWSTSSCSGGVSYNPGQSFTVTRNVNLYAIYQADVPTYTITIDDCDGAGSYSGGSYQSGTSYSTRTYAYPSSGYTFKGWSTSSCSGGVSYNPGQSFTVTRNVNLYAIYQAEYVPDPLSCSLSTNSATITIYGYGGSGSYYYSFTGSNYGYSNSTTVSSNGTYYGYIMDSNGTESYCSTYVSGVPSAPSLSYISQSSQSGDYANATCTLSDGTYNIIHQNTSSLTFYAYNTSGSSLSVDWSISNGSFAYLSSSYGSSTTLSRYSYQSGSGIITITATDSYGNSRSINLFYWTMTKHGSAAWNFYSTQAKARNMNTSGMQTANDRLYVIAEYVESLSGSNNIYYINKMCKRNTNWSSSSSPRPSGFSGWYFRAPYEGGTEYWHTTGNNGAT